MSPQNNREVSLFLFNVLDVDKGMSKRISYEKYFVKQFHIVRPVVDLYNAF
jgi:hypothetical protein